MIWRIWISFLVDPRIILRKKLTFSKFCRGPNSEIFLSRESFWELVARMRRDLLISGHFFEYYDPNYSSEPRRDL